MLGLDPPCLEFTDLCILLGYMQHKGERPSTAMKIHHSPPMKSIINAGPQLPLYDPTTKFTQIPHFL